MPHQMKHTITADNNTLQRRQQMKTITTHKTVVAAVAVVAALALPMVAGAADKMIVNGTDGTTPKMVVTDQGYIGVGTNAPTTPIHISLPGGSSSASLLFHNPGRPTGFTSSDAPSLFIFRNNDASVNSGLPRQGDRLGLMSFGSFISGVNRSLIMFESTSEANMTTSSAPAYLSIKTTDSGSISPTEKIRIVSNGNVGFGKTTPTQKIDVNGGIRLYTAVSKPACDSSTRGVIWFTLGTSTTADTLETCSKDASNNYAWRALF